MSNLTPQEFTLLREYLHHCDIWRSDEDAVELFLSMEESGIPDAKDRVDNLLHKLGASRQ